MRSLALLLAPLALVACTGNQGVSAFAPPDSIWRLAELDGAVFPARATIRFPAPGRVAGQAPCNSYTASQTAPYPWVEITGITATEMACDQLAAEQRFFDALGKAAIAEVAGDTMILSSGAGLEMVFTRQ